MQNSSAAKSNHLPGKLEFLDSIRGFMALNVVLCHFVCTYYPQMYFLEYADSLGGFLSFFATTPLSVLLNGNVAVQYFFILTGFLVGRSFFTKTIPAHSLPSRSLKRYFRLLPVVGAATVFTFLTMRLDLQYHLKIQELVLNPYFLKDYCNFVERLISLPAEIFLNPFIGLNSSYVGPFWTLYYELWGYMFAMALCLVFRERKYRRMEYLAVMIALKLLSGFSNYIPFVMGVLVADLQFNPAPSFHPVLPNSGKPVGKWILALLGGYLACCPMYFTTIYRYMENLPGINTNLVRGTGVAILLFVLLKSPGIQKVLNHPVLVHLGTISFEIYAFHWPIMLSFQAWVFSLLIQKMSYNGAAVSAFLLTLPVIYLTALLMHWLLAKYSTWMVWCKAKLF